MCKGLLNACASYSQGAHTGQWLLSVMIYGRALVLGRQLKLCFAHNLSILKEVNSPTLGLGPCWPHPQPASEAKEPFWAGLGGLGLGREDGELGSGGSLPQRTFWSVEQALLA